MVSFKLIVSWEYNDFQFSQRREVLSQEGEVCLNLYKPQLCSCKSYFCITQKNTSNNVPVYKKPVVKDLAKSNVSTSTVDS
jgi:hypothetical protein